MPSYTATPLHICGDCGGVLYPKEDKKHKRLLWACRLCPYSEVATSPLVYRRVITSEVSAPPGSRDLGDDRTLRRLDKTCPRCGHGVAVVYQAGLKHRDTEMTALYSCLNCRHIARDQ